MPKSSPTSIRLEKELYEKVVDEAKKENRSISQQIEYLIKKYYEIRDTIK